MMWAKQNVFELWVMMKSLAEMIISQLIRLWLVP